MSEWVGETPPLFIPLGVTESVLGYTHEQWKALRTPLATVLADTSKAAMERAMVAIKTGGCLV